MKLYTFDPAPNPQRLKLFMEYKSITIDTHQVDFQGQEQRGDAYLAIIPTGTVPALVLDNGEVLTSVVAMTHYLEALYPERPLLGSTLEEKAAILDWNHRLFTEVFRAVADVFRNTSPGFVDRALPGTQNYAQIPELAERGAHQLQHAFGVLNGELSQRDFLAGSTFSMADIDLLALLHFAGWSIKTEPDATLEHLIAWRQRAQAALGQ